MLKKQQILRKSKCELLSLAYATRHVDVALSPTPPRARRSTQTLCLVVVCLLHAALLQAVLGAGEPVAAAPQPKPEAVTIALVAPAAPALAAPVAEPIAKPEPQPIHPEAKPVTKPVVKPTENTPPIPSETVPAPVVASIADTTPPITTEPPATTDSSTVSEPIFDADYLRNPAPVYPKLSRQRREEGVVMLRVHVLENGEADQLEVLQSSGFERLDEAALRAVKRWQFVPAKRGDEVVAAWVRVPVRFNLNS